MAVKPEHVRDRSTRAMSKSKASPTRDEMEQRFRNLAADSLQGVLVTRGLRPVFVNDTFAAFHGYTCDEILNLDSIMSLVVAKSRPELQQLIDSISTSGPVRFEYEGLHKSGAQVCLQSALKLVQWDDDDALQLTAIDVSELVAAQGELGAIKFDLVERAKTQQSLSGIEGRLADPVQRNEHVDDGIRLDHLSLRGLNQCGAAIRAMSDEATSREDVAERLVRFFYERFTDKEGQPALALVRCFETRAVNELSDDDQSMVQTLVPDPNPQSMCLQLIATAGEQQQWNDAGLSEHHRLIPLPSEAAVERLPMIARLIRELGLDVGGVINASTDLMVDSIDTKVFHVPVARGCPDIPAQEDFVIPFGIRSVVGFGDLLPNGNLFAVILFSKVPISPECALLFSHLSLSVRIALLPFIDSGDNLHARLVATQRLLKNQEAAVARQETQLLTALDELNRSAAALERSNMELQQIAFSASHDLQEPLRSVAGFCQLLQRRYHGQLDDEADEWIEYAVEAAARMRKLVEDLLVYSRIDRQAVPFTRVDWSDVFHDAIALLQDSVHKSGARITCDALPLVAGDRSQLVQLMSNLISNGIKFHRKSPPRVHVSAHRKGDQWLFSVKDNGIGISSDKLQNIFGVFRRLHTQREYPGTGIGLAICRRIVERHGGRIWVESEVGKGSIFYFTLSGATSNQRQKAK